MPQREPLILRHRFALGDTVLLTALARDIHRAYPGRFELLVDCHFGEVWQNNPYARVATGADKRKYRTVEIRYREGIHASKRGQRVHMLSWYHKDFEKKTGLHVPVTAPHADIHLTAAERQPLVSGDYWLLIAGCKQDITNKRWPAGYWQQVIDRLPEHHFVQAGANFKGHEHPELRGVLSTVGMHRSARQFFNLIANAQGVICPVTAAMHIAACFHKPCVVISGGREEPWWEGYVDDYMPTSFGPSCPPPPVVHRFLHTLGQLDCCQTHGCWKRKTVPAPGQTDDLCKYPVTSGTHQVARCMSMIKPDQVIEAVLSYGPASPSTPPRLATPTPSPVAVKSAPVPAPAPASVSTRVRTPKPNYTLFVLCYGDHHELAARCLNSVLPYKRQLDIRVAGNQVCDKTAEYLQHLKSTGKISRLYLSPTNDFKYPVMRRMFADAPSTEHFIWLDDDTRVVHPQWLMQLHRATQHGGSKAGLFGWPMYHDLQRYVRPGHNPLAWFRDSTWWQNRNLLVRGRRSTSAPNGTVIPFVPGWCWAARSELIGRGLPDKRLGHNGGDITIGCQVYQSGYAIVEWNRDKRYVWCPSREHGGRRGYSEAFPWAGRTR